MTSWASPDPEPPLEPPLRLRTGMRRATGFLWWLPIAIAVVAGAAAYTITTSQPDRFRAEANLLLPSASPTPPETYAAFATSPDVIRSTIDALRIPETVGSLRDDVRADAQGTIIRIQAHATTAQGAALLARTLANVVVRDAPTLLLGAPAPELLGIPDPTAARVGPKTARNTAIAIAAGLVFGAILTAGLALRERPVQRPLEVEWLTGLPTLASIPHHRSVHHHDKAPILLSHPHSEEAEAYRTLRTLLDGERADHALRSIVVAGAEPGVGANAVAANLALAFADTGRPTLLVDADLRRPTIHRLFDLPNARGLSDALVSDAPQTLITPAAAQVPLQVMTSGPLPTHPAELLGSPRAAPGDRPPRRYRRAPGDHHAAPPHRARRRPPRPPLRRRLARHRRRPQPAPTPSSTPPAPCAPPAPPSWASCSPTSAATPPTPATPSTSPMIRHRPRRIRP